MKITRRHLRRIIKEEMRRVILSEALTATGTYASDGKPDDEFLATLDDGGLEELSDFSNEIVARIKSQQPGEGDTGYQVGDAKEVVFSSDPLGFGRLSIRWPPSTEDPEIVKDIAEEIAVDSGYVITFTEKFDTPSIADDEVSPEYKGEMWIHLDYIHPPD
jgi:hypothetical protein